MDKNYKLGIITRCDDSGLGNMSQDFYKYLEPEKVMTIYGTYNNHPERFPGAIICNQGIPSLQNIKDFLKDIDVLITFETPYNWNLISEAKKKGVKTIIIPDYEWTTQNPPVEPDLWLCPSKLDYELLKAEGKNVEYMPVPTDRTKIPFRLREKANTFLFINGHGGAIGRNSAREMMEAIARVSMSMVNPPNFIFRSQVQVETTIHLPNIRLDATEVAKDKLYEEGDVFVFPHKFDGLSLPIQEAMAAGMPIITTDFFPFNEMLPKELLFPYDDKAKAKLGDDTREIDIHFIYPRFLAEKIQEIAGKDITELSKKMNELAETYSWFTLKNKYIELLNKIVNKNDNGSL